MVVMRDTMIVFRPRPRGMSMQMVTPTGGVSQL
jgi:hypothetical protein